MSESRKIKTTELLAAWVTWERKPAGVLEAKRMEDACQDFVEEMDCNSTDLRIILSRLIVKHKRADAVRIAEEMFESA